MRAFLMAAAILATPGLAMAQAEHQHDAPVTTHEPHEDAAPAEGEEAHGAHGGHDMSAALGDYLMTREASGTSWQPDSSAHEGIHWSQGGWSLMGHALFNGTYSSQGGRRGDDKAFLSGMVMLSAARPLSDKDRLTLKAMVSPDPLMGKRGYPLLLASGETADGTTSLVDRQHPHDMVIELSASLSHRFTDEDSVFVYGGLPGEPAFGPPAFMHRMSIQDSPEAPIAHHWLDSTHITFGVVTAGFIHGPWKIEASRFHGREPDQRRYNIETGGLDSTAARLSWNPSPIWSLQASCARVKSPEQLDPDEDQTKWSASAIRTVPFGDGGSWSVTAAWGRRIADHETLDALVLETAVRPNTDWMIFARAERTDNNELTTVGGHHGPTYTVGKVSIGAIRDFEVSEHAVIGFGALYAVNFIPSGLRSAYGDGPGGGMAFVRLKIR